jgi:hypothetical protein
MKAGPGVDSNAGWHVEKMSRGHRSTQEVDDLEDALRVLAVGVEYGQWSVVAIIRPDGIRVEGDELDQMYSDRELRLLREERRPGPPPPRWIQ